jgi:hypothetical protein
MRVNQAVFDETLRILGYRLTCEQGNEVQWRYRTFHLFVRARIDKRGSSVDAVTLHRDAHAPCPPGHRAVFGGQDVEAEFNRILGAYKTRMRGGKQA